jgi:hypothetical protein
MSFESMSRLVMPRVRKAPFELVRDELREAAIKFFTRTEVWREALGPMQFGAGQAEMEIALPSGTALVSVPDGTIDGEDLTIAGYAIGGDPESLILGFVPTKASTIIIEAVLKPSFDSSGIPERLEAEYGRQIASGAIAALKAMRGTEWYDPDGGVIALDEFKGAIAAARRRRLQGKTNRIMCVQPVSFF